MTKANSKRGKKARASGSDFERRVRKDLEDKGWIVAKWQNNVSDIFEQDIGEYVRELIPAKNKFNPFSKAMMLGGGFPDFIAYKLFGKGSCAESVNGKIERYDGTYGVIGVESKVNGYLDKVERAKCEWLLKKKIFSRILIAQKTKVGRKIVVVYKEFK